VCSSQWTSNNVNLPELKSQMEQLVARAEATAHALKGFDDLKRELLTNANNVWEYEYYFHVVFFGGTGKH